MAYPTFQEIVQDVITEAGLVSGTAVQTYTEPQAKLAVNRMFGYLFNKDRWPHLWDWQVATLDGVTGKFTSALTGVRQYEDIAEIRIDNQNGRSIVQSVGTEHLFVTGSDPLFWRPLPYDDADAATKFVKIYPIASASDVVVLCGHRPDKFVGNDDVVPFDRDVITLGSLWYLIGADGFQSANAIKAQGMFDSAFSDYITKRGSHQIGHGRGSRAPSSTFSLS